MSAFLYFLPGVTRALLAPGETLSRSILAARGLSDVFADVKDLADLALNELSLASGPGGSPGVLVSILPVASREPPRRMKFDPKDQTIRWSKRFNPAGDGECFLGLDTLALPTPADLERYQVLRGYDVELADGQRWHVPTVRYHGGGTCLPRSMGWDERGQFRTAIKPGYEKAWDDSGRIFSFLFEKESETIYEPEACELCTSALALNYRLDRPEISALGLLSSNNVRDVFDAIVDWPKIKLFIEEQKKSADRSRAASSPNSTPGSGDGSPITDPAAATSASSNNAASPTST